MAIEARTGARCAAAIGRRPGLFGRCSAPLLLPHYCASLETRWGPSHGPANLSAVQRRAVLTPLPGRPPPPPASFCGRGQRRLRSLRSLAGASFRAPGGTGGRGRCWTRGRHPHVGPAQPWRLLLQLPSLPFRGALVVGLPAAAGLGAGCEQQRCRCSQQDHANSHGANWLRRMERRTKVGRAAATHPMSQPPAARLTEVAATACTVAGLHCIPGEQ